MGWSWEIWVGFRQNWIQAKRCRLFVSRLEKLNLQGNGADQYILRSGVPVMLSEESLIPAALTKAGVFGYTNTAK
jgi:hypothetical protein